MIAIPSIRNPFISVREATLAAALVGDAIPAASTAFLWRGSARATGDTPFHPSELRPLAPPPPRSRRSAAVSLCPVPRVARRQHPPCPRLGCGFQIAFYQGAPSLRYPGAARRRRPLPLRSTLRSQRPLSLCNSLCPAPSSASLQRASRSSSPQLLPRRPPPRGASARGCRSRSSSSSAQEPARASCTSAASPTPRKPARLHQGCGTREQNRRCNIYLSKGLLKDAPTQLCYAGCIVSYQGYILLEKATESDYCGVYMLKNMNCWILDGKLLKIREVDVPSLRKTMLTSSDKEIYHKAFLA